MIKAPKPLPATVCTSSDNPRQTWCTAIKCPCSVSPQQFLHLKCLSLNSVVRLWRIVSAINVSTTYRCVDFVRRPRSYNVRQNWSVNIGQLYGLLLNPKSVVQRINGLCGSIRALSRTCGNCSLDLPAISNGLTVVNGRSTLTVEVSGYLAGSPGAHGISASAAHRARSLCK